ncbi:MAG: hypothetical protein IKE04_05620 [Oscillospiraceae bacterium]|nr:hypothetical protein [Oscillospiraceae bacterium]
MEEQKILFADLYRLLGAIKTELKDTGKEIERLLLGGDWESISMTVNGIISEAQMIGNVAQAMIDNADLFLQNGPYPGQTAGMLPLESMAKKE